MRSIGTPNKVTRRECRSRRRWLAWAAAWAIVLAYAGTSPAQGPGISREYPLKAAFLYNFGNYVEWPSDAFAGDDAPFVLGVMGTNPFGATLHEIAAAKKLHGRAIAIRQIATPDDLRACHMVFVGAGVAEADRERAVDSVAALPVLVVGEASGFAEQGAVINFFVEQNKVRIEVNDQAARDRRLKISSKLMSLARLVEPRHVAAGK